MAVDTGKKQISKNLVFNIIAFVLQFAISFYISPVIVSKVGKAAYGFIGIANDFVSYAAIIASVFNSVASRFIANEYYQKNYEKADAYFSSLMTTNLVLSLLFSVVGLIVVVDAEKLLDIPAALVTDVKWTFALVFASYLVTLMTVVLTSSAYVANRTDVLGRREIIKQCLRFAFVLFFLNFVSVKLYWVSAAMLFATAIVALMNIRIPKRFTPEITFRWKAAKVSYVKELALAGGWLAFTNISNLLMRGLDLTLANAMLGANAMGLLSVARTIPNNFTSAIGTIAPLFTPVFILCYVQKRNEELTERINKSVRTMALVLFVPISGFIVYSNDFYTLWQKGLTETDIALVTAISTITVVQAYFNATTATLAQISVVVNKLKFPVFVSLGCGVANILAVVILLKTTDLGLLGIVIPGTVLFIIRYVFFNSFYAAKVLGERIWRFIGNEMITWAAIPLVVLECVLVKKWVPVHSWGTMVLSAALAGLIGYATVAVLLARKECLGFIAKMRGRKK